MSGLRGRRGAVTGRAGWSPSGQPRHQDHGAGSDDVRAGRGSRRSELRDDGPAITTTTIVAVERGASPSRGNAVTAVRPVHPSSASGVAGARKTATLVVLAVA